jgi:hypothetical protein
MGRGMGLLRQELERTVIQDIEDWIRLTENYLKATSKYTYITQIAKMSKRLDELYKDVRYILVNHLGYVEE